VTRARVAGVGLQHAGPFAGIAVVLEVIGEDLADPGNDEAVTAQVPVRFQPDATVRQADPCDALDVALAELSFEQYLPVRRWASINLWMLSRAPIFADNHGTRMTCA